MDADAAAALFVAEELIEDARVRILVDEEIPALRARLAGLRDRGPELVAVLGAVRGRQVLALVAAAHDALVVFEASR
ncbi:hypothetical protein [Micromonospora sp. DT62]|uniref:hypothetical protein n=1 Tax=Micromonospora sp. DT62 TaxID=3416521 RepID=UPI003CF8096C